MVPRLPPAALLSLVGLAACHPKPPPLASVPTEPIPRYGDKVALLAMPVVRSEYCPALAVGLLDGDHREVHGFGAGVDGQAVDGSTVFEIGSVTKAFTGALFEDAIRRGEVSAEQSITEIFPELGAADQLVPISLAALATHRSGLARMPADWGPDDPTDPYADYALPRLLAQLPAEEVSEAEPPAYTYSNLGMAVLGQALAKAAGLPYEDLVRHRILDPLGMDNTSFELASEHAAHRVPGHDEAGRPVPPWTFDAFAPAGALRSTADDMLAFLDAHLPAPDRDGELQASLRTAAQPKADDGEDRMGWGWHLGLPWEPEGDLAWHNGQTAGFHTWAGFEPGAQESDGRGVVVLCNQSGMVPDALGRALLLMLREEPYDFQLTPLAEVDAQTLVAMTGLYQLTPELGIEITLEDHRLFARVDGQQALRIYPADERTFRYRAVEATIEFIVGEDGTAEGLVLEQGGQRLEAPRIAVP